MHDCRISGGAGQLGEKIKTNPTEAARHHAPPSPNPRFIPGFQFPWWLSLQRVLGSPFFCRQLSPSHNEIPHSPILRAPVCPSSFLRPANLKECAECLPFSLFSSPFSSPKPSSSSLFLAQVFS